MAVTVLVAPEPVIVMLPGERVRVQLPVAGRPLRATLPVDRAHVGWVIVPTTGAVGVSGCVLITTLEDAGETHPRALVTVKVYVPGARPEIVVLVPDPVAVCPPGLRVTVHSPVEGRLLRITEPVGSAHVG